MEWGATSVLNGTVPPFGSDQGFFTTLDLSYNRLHGGVAWGRYHSHTHPTTGFTTKLYYLTSVNSVSYVERIHECDWTTVEIHECDWTTSE